MINKLFNAYYPSSLSFSPGSHFLKEMSRLKLSCGVSNADAKLSANESFDVEFVEFEEFDEFLGWVVGIEFAGFSGSIASVLNYSL